jgi:hypothetical protein
VQLKRYSNNELQGIFTEIFYNHLSAMNEGTKETPAHVLHNKYTETFNIFNQRIEEYSTLLQTHTYDENVQDSITKQLCLLKLAREHVLKGNMRYQKELYQKTKSTDFSRTSITIPLNKKINSYYDDFYFEVVFYDDVCTLNGNFSVYENLKTDEERKEFIKNNTEITNIGLLWMPNENLRAIIEVVGELSYNNPMITNKGVTLLPKKFSDFNTLTLKDTSEIQNNDLKQFIQTKIDMDKENMRLLSKQIIRGDEYCIYSPSEDNEFYIRYICRSTGRVYYNKLNLDNLSISKEFKKDDYDSYSRAWWNLNTLGSSVDGKPVIRC